MIKKEAVLERHSPSCPAEGVVDNRMWNKHHSVSTKPDSPTEVKLLVVAKESRVELAYSEE